MGSRANIPWSNNQQVSNSVSTVYSPWVNFSACSVHGEFNFSPYAMPLPEKSAETGSRLTGDDMCAYMETFAEKFLAGKIKCKTEIRGIERSSSGSWLVTVEDLFNGSQEVLNFSHIVLCTGVHLSIKVAHRRETHQQVGMQ